MKTSKSIISTITGAIALFVAAVAPASGERVFPPPHLSANAVFEAGTVSDQAVKGAWYAEAESDRRALLKDAEKQESSPHPSSYYFAKARVFPPQHSNNDSGARQDENRSPKPSTVVDVSERGPIVDDNT